MKGIERIQDWEQQRAGRLLLFFSKSVECMLGEGTLVSVYNSAKAARPARPTKPPAAR